MPAIRARPNPCGIGKHRFARMARSYAALSARRVDRGGSEQRLTSSSIRTFAQRTGYA